MGYLGKKYYKYVDGKKIEREPTEREKKSQNNPGYEDLKKLSLGITSEESDQADIKMVDKEKEDRKAEVFADKWKKFATGSDVKNKIDNILDLNNDQFETLRDNLRSIVKDNPDFLDQLRLLFEPLLYPNESQGEEGIDEGSNKDKIMSVCNRNGYYQFGYFLKQIDLINRANSGKLFQQSK